MPAYNVQKYIAESIESVITQSYSNWELIIVDDGSTDNTAEIVKQYQLTEARIKYIYQENGKQSKARNTAIKNSSGYYIAFLDADDLWVSEKLQISVNEITSRNYDLLFTDCYYFEDGDQIIASELKSAGVTSSTYEGKEAIITFLERNRIPNLTVLVKRDALKKTGDFLEIAELAEDYELWLRLLQQGAVFKSIATPLSLYRMRSDSLTAKDRLAVFETMIIIKSFSKRHVEYRKYVNQILKTQFKYWLYNGYKATNKNYRIIITSIHPYIITISLYLLSFILPFKYLRKISNRTLCL